VLELDIGLTNFLIIFFSYLIPLYLANSTPIVIHGTFPLDFKLKLKTKRILGDGKTILGTLAGILSGIIFGLIYYFLTPIGNLIPNYLTLLVFLVIGGVLGDIVESFFKRRIGISRGEQWLLFDQIDFILGGLILSSIIVVPDIKLVLLLIGITYFAHRAFNYLAYKVKLKKVPW
jgi:CDP-2,3-bis-(O-geranylgeranyl)-sn-glycerol synthase